MFNDQTIFATAQQQAYNYLREKILSGEYEGGTRLNPAEIAQALGISRMPVREALRQLDAEGLVTMRPNRGALVTRLTPFEVEELFEMRAVLEGLAVRFALPNLDDNAFADLAALKERMDRARGDPRLWIKRHDEFHQFLCDLAQRTRLAREINRIRNAVHPYLLMSVSVYSTTEMEGYEHDALVQTIAAGDADTAERYMHDHVRRAATGVIDFLVAQEAAAIKRPNPAAGSSPLLRSALETGEHGV